MLGRDRIEPGVGDPVIGIAAAVDALVDIEPLLPPPSQRGDRDALDRLGPAIGKIDVDQHALAHALGEDFADNVRRKLTARFPKRRLARARFIRLRQRDRGNAEKCALHRTGDGAGIDNVLAGIAAAVDAGEDQIRHLAVEQMTRAHDDAIGRRAAHRIPALGDLAQAQWIVERQRMRDAGLIVLRRNHPHVVRQRAGDLRADVETVRMNAVVVGD